MADARAYSVGKFAMDVGKQNAGWLYSAEGGQATADVVTEKLGVDHLQHKHLGPLKYEEMTITCGTGMSHAFYNWIKASFDHKYTRCDGAIHNCNYDAEVVNTLEFFQGLISEVGFPALDAASKDACKMTLKWKPEHTRRKAGDKKKIGVTSNPIGKGEQKMWLPSNFRIKIAGLDKACSRINKIEAITVKQKNVDNPIGELRDYECEPASLEIPNLVVTVLESHADDFYKWHHDFVILGNCHQDHEKTATLEYLTPNLKETLFQLDLHGLGIFKLTRDKAEAGADGLAKVKVEMYCEDIKFAYKKGTFGSANV